MAWSTLWNSEKLQRTISTGADDDNMCCNKQDNDKQQFRCNNDMI